MAKQKKIFNRRQREFMIWITLEHMNNTATNQQVQYEIEDIMEQFRLSKEHVVAAILFLQHTSQGTLTV